jgi:2-polyprenyl-6-methoxyphenol hydroxylase-like FAD-dependent oxidoreductase
VTMAGQTSIAIVGGGIGGLTAAILLLRAGFDVPVYEQAKALGEVGAGINIGPNASRILYRIGIANELDRTGVKPSSFVQRRWDTVVFCSVPRWAKTSRRLLVRLTIRFIGAICIAL